jgi:nuclease HARBI1
MFELIKHANCTKKFENRPRINETPRGRQPVSMKGWQSSDAETSEEEGVSRVALSRVSRFLVGKYRHADDVFEDEQQRLRAKKRRLKLRLAASVLMASKTLLEAYVSYRGGLFEMLNYVVPQKRFDPASFCLKNFRAHFRFDREEVEFIIQQLELPPYIATPQRDKADTFEVFCMMCMKFAYPTRFCSMVREYGRSQGSLSRLIKELRRLLYIQYSTALRFPAPLTEEQCACFSSKVRSKCGHPVVVGFIDGTVREICKPSVLQGPLYNGKDRIHSLKYQAINSPDGIIMHLAGPYPGSRHDQFMLRESKILEWIGSFPQQAGTGWPHVIYGDCGYSSVAGKIVVPYHDEELNAVHAGFNNSMTSVRISIEWAFGAILRNWASLRWVPDQQLLSRRNIGQIYFVAALLTNLLNCVRPNQTSLYFNCSPPSLAKYLAWLKEERREEMS